MLKPILPHLPRGDMRKGSWGCRGHGHSALLTDILPPWREWLISMFHVNPNQSPSTPTMPTVQQTRQIYCQYKWLQTMTLQSLIAINTFVCWEGPLCLKEAETQLQIISSVVQFSATGCLSWCLPWHGHASQCPESLLSGAHGGHATTPVPTVVEVSV